MAKAEAFWNVLVAYIKVEFWEIMGKDPQLFANGKVHGQIFSTFADNFPKIGYSLKLKNAISIL